MLECTEIKILMEINGAGDKVLYDTAQVQYSKTFFFAQKNGGNEGLSYRKNPDPNVY